MIDEARLEDVGSGLTPANAGWFVVSVGEAAWVRSEAYGRLKNDWALSPVRVRGLDRVRVHADLTILAKLACALSRTRAVAFAG